MKSMICEQLSRPYDCAQIRRNADETINLQDVHLTATVSEGNHSHDGAPGR